MDGFLGFIFLLGVVILIVSSKNDEKNEKIEKIRKKNKDIENPDGKIQCPKCLSLQTSANKQGITLTKGVIGSQNVWITCLECGYKWKAGSH